MVIDQSKVEEFFDSVQDNEWDKVGGLFAPNARSIMFGTPFNQNVGIWNSSTLIVSLMYYYFLTKYV